MKPSKKTSTHQPLLVESLPVIPVHGADAVQLLHTQNRAQICRNFFQRLVVLLVDDQEGHSLYSKICLR